MSFLDGKKLSREREGGDKGKSTSGGIRWLNHERVVLFFGGKRGKSKKERADGQRV
jgi:hypothetical protein